MVSRDEGGSSGLMKQGFAESWRLEFGFVFWALLLTLESALISWRIKDRNLFRWFEAFKCKGVIRSLPDPHPKFSFFGDCVPRLETAFGSWESLAGDAGVLLETLGLKTVRNTLFLKGSNLKNWKSSLPFHKDEQKSFHSHPSCFISDWETF